MSAKAQGLQSLGLIVQYCLSAQEKNMSLKKISLALFFLAVVSVAASCSQTITRWEYKTFYGTHADFSNLGKEGWELVGTTRTGDGLNDTVLYFKRPLQ